MNSNEFQVKAGFNEAQYERNLRKAELSGGDVSGDLCCLICGRKANALAKGSYRIVWNLATGDVIPVAEQKSFIASGKDWNFLAIGRECVKSIPDALRETFVTKV